MAEATVGDTAAAAAGVRVRQGRQGKCLCRSQRSCFNPSELQLTRGANHRRESHSVFKIVTNTNVRQHRSHAVESTHPAVADGEMRP